jgi:hypothetical protein
MPLKRYITALLIVFLWVSFFLYLNIRKIVSPDEGTLLMQQLQSEILNENLQRIQAIVTYIFMALYTVILAIIFRRIVLVVFRKSSLITVFQNTLNAFQKIGIFLLKSGYYLSVGGMALFIIFATIAGTGGVSGIPLLFVFIIGIFLFVLSVFFIELGNYKANKSLKVAP